MNFKKYLPEFFGSYSQEEQLERLKDLFEKKSYEKVITIFESDESLKTNKEIVNEYLWSLWGNNESKKTRDLAHEYNKKFNTEEWDWFIGKYAEQQKRFNVALSYFDESSDDYNRVKKIFDDYDSLYKDEKYKEVIEYFENKLNLSHSKTKHEIVNKYLWSLYKNSGTEKKALEKTKVFLEKYGDSDRWFNLAGHINKYLGKHNKNDNIIYLNDALFFFQKTGNEEEIKIVNDIIKQQAKEAAAREKQQTKEAVAREIQLAKEAVAREKQLAKKAAQDKKNKTHDYSISNGISYCRYCGGGDTSEIRSSPCTRELGHKYTLRKTKYNGFQPICNTCGDERSYCQPLSENTKICGVTVGFYTCEEYLGYMRRIS